MVAAYCIDDNIFVYSHNLENLLLSKSLVNYSVLRLGVDLFIFY